jgi:hypothetical protein
MCWSRRRMPTASPADEHADRRFPPAPQSPPAPLISAPQPQQRQQIDGMEIISA